MELLVRLLIFAITLTIVSCGTTEGVKVQSTTKGSIFYLYNASSKKEEKVGENKIELLEEKIEEAAGDGNIVVVRVSKFGYLPAYLFIPADWTLKGSIDVSLTKVDSTYFKQLTEKDYVDKISKTVFDFLKIQSHIESSDIKKAKDAIDVVEKEYGEIPPLHVLKGNYFILIKDYSSALLSYKRAYKLYPKDENIKKAIMFLKDMGSE